MNVHWLKCMGGVWCKVNAVNLAHGHFDGMEGVYIIWHGGSQPQVVHVGGGTIREQLEKDRTDDRIQEFASLDLYVTWAPVQASERDGVERYLADYWHPIVEERHPNALPIEVNSPW